jgi:hypothetical protein
MAKYQVMLSDKTGHKVRSLKAAVALSRGLPFITRKVLRGGRRSPVLRKYEVLGTMAHCVATKEVG